MISLLPFLLSLVFNIILVPIVRKYSLKTGHVNHPRDDRWNQNPVANLGGIAIFSSFIMSLIIFDLINRVMLKDLYEFRIQWDLLLGSVVVFLLGLYDDFKTLSPPQKLIGQIMAASVVIYGGYTTQFFSPRIENVVLAQIPNIILTFIWIIGITNAINLIDNMDGLAGGISLIAALFLSYFFLTAGNTNLGFLTVSIAGSVLGFLIFNFPPASIFMGDSGSLFLGFTLAVMAIARQPQASNVLAVMGVPTLIFLIPIIDTSMVFFTRILRGASPVKGGKDHTSHRLVAFGFSERKVLLILFGVAILSGLVAAQLESIRYWYSLVIVPVLVLTFALFTAYLGGLKVVDTPNIPQREKAIPRIIGDLTYRIRILEIILDFFLIGIAYYLAFLFRFNFNMNEERLEIFVNTLPIALFGVYFSFIIFGIYKLVWKYASIEDLWRYFQACLGGVLVVWLILEVLFPDGIFISRLFLIFFFLLIIGLALSRSSFRFLQMLSNRQPKPDNMNILIFGAGDSGELALIWSMVTLKSKYRPVGFIDEDPIMLGRQIHGLPILGNIELLPKIIQAKKISGIVISSAYSKNDLQVIEINKVCQNENCWVKHLKIELID
jgi:UDP-GlcNAc:undecaprenyl-phosphate/decaprenyl-phosphate GlcNAc-1-phosphate transferase